MSNEQGLSIGKKLGLVMAILLSVLPAAMIWAGVSQPAFAQNITPTGTAASQGEDAAAGDSDPTISIWY
ncbi:MAG: hypothetical protein R3293_13205, partial [Candidatus Promineifilaceae bacterium]|nr:hypothetical protein [Candidatus Promineifilaceae bacterium]